MGFMVTNYVLQVHNDVVTKKKNHNYKTDDLPPEITNLEYNYYPLIITCHYPTKATKSIHFFHKMTFANTPKRGVTRHLP